MSISDKRIVSDVVLAGFVVVGIEIEGLDPVNPSKGESYLWDNKTVMMWDNGMEVLTDK